MDLAYLSQATHKKRTGAMTQTTHFTAGLDARLPTAEAFSIRYVSAAEQAYYRNRARDLRSQQVGRLIRGFGRFLHALVHAPSRLPDRQVGGKLLVTAE